MYGCDSWTIKKTKGWRIDTTELWCWRRFLRVPWTVRRSSQSILKEISPEYSLEGLMLKLKLQYFGHPMWRDGLLEKTLMLGKIEGKRGRSRGWDGWMASPTQWTWVWASSGSWRRTEKPGMLQSMGWQRVRHNWATELSSSWGSHSKNNGVGCHFLLQWSMFCQNSSYDPLSWVALHGMAHNLIELHKPFCQDKALLHEGD